MGVDQKFDKYPNYSPYNYCLQNPVNAVDPDGKDVILLVWATGTGYGHAAIAVSNYKTEYYKVKENGKTVTKSRQVKDGTYTYYDLWPGVDNNNDGISDGVGEAGPKDMYSGPIADYQIKKIISENQLVNGDPSGREGKSPDGVIKLYSGYDEDMETIQDLKSHMESNNEYTSISNNCSNFASCGVAEVLDRFSSFVQSESQEVAYGFHFTTPNSLFKYVLDRIKSSPEEGKLLKSPGDVINILFKDAVIEPAKQQQKQSEN